MKHPHYDLIVQWAQDTSKTVWVYSVESKQWYRMQEVPQWFPWCKYHIGPTPPKTMRTLGGLEYPAPETEAPPIESIYYMPRITGGTRHDWTKWYNDFVDVERIQAGLVHLTKEAAEAHARAILAAIKQANQGE